MAIRMPTNEYSDDAISCQFRCAMMLLDIAPSFEIEGWLDTAPPLDFKGAIINKS